MKNLTVIALAGSLSLSTLYAQSEAKVDFKTQVLPILRDSCFECHGPEKQKGRLNLSTKESALKGGSSAVAIVPGKAEESELYIRVTLPPDHDDRMPSEGDPLTKAQTDLLRDWINQGAEWPDDVAVVQASEKPKGKTGLDKLAPVIPTDAENQAIAKLEEMGISVRPIAMNVSWKEANLGLLGTNVNDEVLAILKNIPSLVHLNLRGTSITDAGLEHLKSLNNLLELHLEKTAITDAGLAHLKALTNLTYLNLYGTSVTDAGLQHLKGLTDLESLYLWQTKVTTEGTAELKAALPQLKIDTGWDLAELVKEDESNKEKKDEKKEN